VGSVQQRTHHTLEHETDPQGSRVTLRDHSGVDGDGGAPLFCLQRLKPSSYLVSGIEGGLAT